MEAIHEIRMDMRIAWGSVSGPRFSTYVNEFKSGEEERNANWSRGRKYWEVGREGLSREDVEYLEAFFRARMGMLYGFRARDWNSFKKVAEPLALLTNTSAQLQFLYPDPINPTYQKVSKPVLLANVNENVDEYEYSPDITLTNNGSAYLRDATFQLTAGIGVGTTTISKTASGGYFPSGSIITFPGAITATTTAAHAQGSTSIAVTGVTGTVASGVTGTVSNWTIDRTTGLITFANSQAGRTLTWSGSYDWPVRFDTDEAKFLRSAQDDHSWTNLMLIELKF